MRAEGTADLRACCPDSAGGCRVERVIRPGDRLTFSAYLAKIRLRVGVGGSAYL